MLIIEFPTAEQAMEFHKKREEEYKEKQKQYYSQFPEAIEKTMLFVLEKIQERVLNGFEWIQIELYKDDENLAEFYRDDILEIHYQALIQVKEFLEYLGYKAKIYKYSKNYCKSFNINVKY